MRHMQSDRLCINDMIRRCGDGAGVGGAAGEDAGHDNV